MKKTYKLTFLGTGTSTGVPQIGCKCAACTSADPHDNRLRASALLQTPHNTFLIDAGPDLRMQLLRQGSPAINALLVTHSHYDHVGGIDDLRPYCHPDAMPVFCRNDVDSNLHDRMPYCFAQKLYPGVPTFAINDVTPGKPFDFNGDRILPVEVMHANLPILGFRIGNLAYITDCKVMPEKTLALLQGLDVLVINALRKKEHHSHLSLDQALQIVSRLNPGRTYLTHMSHDMGPAKDLVLPPGVQLAYDGLTIRSN